MSLIYERQNVGWSNSKSKVGPFIELRRKIHESSQHLVTGCFPPTQSLHTFYAIQQFIIWLISINITTIYSAFL